ncbi:hypothetical protein ESA_02123 [Cronobacter sakazakii ATCC BAA-894]|uniref:Uncharacterized protein n=1 Tax=Cronobacter sakazakii (strain ATCC BAA-894) TaxID=290339 RepID=A7MNY1_CROS8|nr:hypothetical protein ESA_02123 [Cronobacter sakazakii ATCC BAA-894]
MAEAHIRHVRTAAHIHIFFVVIQARFIVTGNIFIKNSDFVVLATLHKRFAGFLPAHFFLDDVVISFRQLVHTLFEGVDIFLSQGMVEIDIVIKAVVDNRANRHFGMGPQLFDGMTQQVRTGVTDNFQTVFIFRGNNRELSVLFDTVVSVHQLAIHAACDTGFREARTDIQGNIHGADSMVVMALAAIRKRNNRHYKSLFTVVTHTQDHI